MHTHDITQKAQHELSRWTVAIFLRSPIRLLISIKWQKGKWLSDVEIQRDICSMLNVCNPCMYMVDSQCRYLCKFKMEDIVNQRLSIRSIPTGMFIFKIIALGHTWVVCSLQSGRDVHPL